MSEQNAALFRRVVEDIWNAKNPGLIPEIYAADFVMHTPVGTFEGPDGYMQIYDTYVTAFPDCRFTIHDLFASGDREVLRYTYSGTHNGELMEVAPTGRRVSIGGLALARIAGGRIAEEWPVWDLYGLMQQIGAIPSTP
jgi:predicted ester cyclase